MNVVAKLVAAATNEWVARAEETVDEQSNVWRWRTAGEDAGIGLEYAGMHKARQQNEGYQARCEQRSENKEATLHKLELKVKREARPMQIVNRLGPVAKRRFQQATPSVKAEAERRERRRRAAAETAARQREQRARRFVLSRAEKKKVATQTDGAAGTHGTGIDEDGVAVNDDETGTVGGGDCNSVEMAMRTAAARARQLAKDVQRCRQEAEAAEQRVAQLKAEADATEETAKRLAAQLEDERQQDEHGQCMVEEISEIKLRRAIRTLEKAKEQAAEQMQALRAVTKPTREQRVELEVLERNAVCLEALKRFDAAAEPPDGRGRRRLVVKYSHGGQAGGRRGRHYARGGYWEKKANGTHKWRTVSLQGCPREVRGLLAGEYYHDVDMVNSLPNVAKQLHKLGMTSEANVRVLSQLCAERKKVFAELIEYYDLKDEPELDITARDVAKSLPIRLLHGGSEKEWRRTFGVDELTPPLPMPFANKLDEELGRLRRDVYNYMLQHDPAWTRGVEAHIRQEKGGGGIGEESLMNKVEAGIFARVIQDIEDACLDKSRRVLRSSGWTARSWQQDGLLVEGEVGVEASKERLEGAMRKAEAAVAAGVTVGGQMVAGLEIELLQKPFFQEATEPTLERLARPRAAVTTEDEARAAAMKTQREPESTASRAAAAAAAAAAAGERAMCAAAEAIEAGEALTTARATMVAAATERAAEAAAAAAAVRAAARAMRRNRRARGRRHWCCGGS